MYLNFNVLNNEVFETGCDDKMIAVLQRCILRNENLADENKQPWKGDNGWEFKDSDVTTDRVN